MKLTRKPFKTMRCTCFFAALILCVSVVIGACSYHNDKPDRFFITENPGSGSDARTNSLGMTFVAIAPGTFMMGSPEDEPGRDDDETLHEVTLTKGYYMQTTPVTQGQWRAVMGDNPSSFHNCGDDCPVETVTWYDVQDFIKALNAKSDVTYRLPTEAEWEYAARAGSTTAFANGEIMETGGGYDPVLYRMGWYRFNAKYKTHPVAQKDPNAWGLYDVHGNVWEWVADSYGPYPTSPVVDPPVVDPKDASSGWTRVLRGGALHNDARLCRSAKRLYYPPDRRYYSFGFRLALD